MASSINLPGIVNKFHLELVISSFGWGSDGKSFDRTNDECYHFAQKCL